MNKFKNSLPITCNSEVLQVICNLQTNSYLNNKKSLLSFIKDQLTQIYGKHKYTYKSEYQNYVWEVEFENNSYYIFTSKGGGTSIELITDEFNLIRSNTRSIILFIKHLQKLIDNL